MKKKMIKQLKQKQQLELDIRNLEKKKKDMNFITDWETKLDGAIAAKREANKKYTNLMRINQDINNKIDTILEVEQAESKPLTILPSQDHNKSEAIANIIACDWHCEEKVDPEAVNYLNKYNPTIAKKRVEAFVEKAVRLVQIERKAIVIKEGVLAFLGDLLGGAFKEDLTMTNFKTAPEALLFCYDLCCIVMDYILKYGGFKKLTVVCKTGNHSRLTEKKIFKVAQENTLEWMLYHFLKKQYKGKAEFIIPKSYRYILNEYGFPIGFHHGDAIRYMGGIGGITVSANRNILRASKSEDMYLDVFGHHHTSHPSENFICSSSLVGYNEMAHKFGFAYQPPSQYLFLIHKNWGRISDRPIYVDKNMKKGIG